jgi:hypothetical protein
MHKLTSRIGIFALAAVAVGCANGKDKPAPAVGESGPAPSGLVLKLDAPATIYVNQQLPGSGNAPQPKSLKLTLTVTNPNAMTFKGQSRDTRVATFVVKRESNGEVVYRSPAVGGAAMTDVQIDKGESKTYERTMDLPDAKLYMLDGLVATGTFAPTGESASATTQVKIAH